MDRSICNDNDDNSKSLDGNMDNDDDSNNNDDDIDSDNVNHARRSRTLPAGDKTMTPSELMASQ